MAIKKKPKIRNKIKIKEFKMDIGNDRLSNQIKEESIDDQQSS